MRLKLLLAFTAILGSGALSLYSQTPYQIPIYHSGTGLRIYAKLGDGANSQMVPYLLDSGSPHVFATHGVWWDGAGAPPVPTPDTPEGSQFFRFAADVKYYFNTTATKVTLGQQNGAEIASTTGHANVGYITNIDAGGTTKSPYESYQEWAATYGGNPYTSTSQAPLTSDQTFGNFGVGLYGTSTLGTIAAQIDTPGLTKGFIINTNGAGATQGVLTIGLDSTELQRFTTTPGAIVLPMQALGTLLPGGAPAYAATQVTSSVVHLDDNGTEYDAAVPTIFDTGGGNEVVFYQDQTGPDAVPGSFLQNGGTHGYVKAGVHFQLTGANPSNIQTEFMGFIVQNSVPAENYLDVDGNLTVGITGVRINTGIQAFYEYEVMFNLEEGYLALLPIPVPEPGSLGLLGLGLVVAAVYDRRKNRRS